MKVSKIEIKDFQQFKDFELDLTYPAGHPKAGQPLDKVCFIGQSGTGKTTILKLIYALMNDKRSSSQKEVTNPNVIVDISYDNKAFVRYIHPKITEEDRKTLQLSGLPIEVQNSFTSNIITLLDSSKNIIPENNNINPINYFNELIEGVEHKVNFFFPANLVSNINNLVKNNTQIAKQLATEINQRDIEKYLNELRLKLNGFYHFDQDDYTDFWKIFLVKQLEYENHYSLFTYQITELMRDKKFEEAKSKTDELEVWAKNKKSPLDEFAALLNPIIEHFSLSVDTSRDYRSLKEIEFFYLKNLQEKSLHYSELSTGTLHLLLLFFPIIQLSHKTGIVLIDEVENSLFPDIQRTLINYYTELAPEAQFFFATHSPLIASQFEPCERFILTFDEETGFVKAHRGIAPEGDDANDLLSKDFATEVLTPKGVEKYQEFIRLRSEIRKETNPEKKEALSIQYFELANQYNFKLPNAN
jgi:predicted ATPase